MEYSNYGMIKKLHLLSSNTPTLQHSNTPTLQQSTERLPFMKSLYYAIATILLASGAADAQIVSGVMTVTGAEMH